MSGRLNILCTIIKIGALYQSCSLGWQDWSVIPKLFTRLTRLERYTKAVHSVDKIGALYQSCSLGWQDWSVIPKLFTRLTRLERYTKAVHSGAMVNILLSCENHLHDRIISLRVAHKTSLTPPLFIEVAVPNLEKDRSFISLLPLSTTFFNLFCNCSETVWYFFNLFCNCSETVWYFFFFFFCNCSETVWYFFLFIV